MRGRASEWWLVDWLLMKENERCESVNNGWLVGRLVGWLVGLSVGQSVVNENEWVGVGCEWEWLNWCWLVLNENALCKAVPSHAGPWVDRFLNNEIYCYPLTNKANLRDLIAATGLVISNWIQIVNFSARVTVKFDGWPCKTIGHLFYATSSFVLHFVPIGEFKLKLQSGNAQSGSNWMIFRAVRRWNLTDDLAKQ